MSSRGFFFGPSSPADPVANACAWWDETAGAFKVWTGSQWDAFTQYHVDFAIPSEGGTGEDSSSASGFPYLDNGTWVFPVTGAVGDGETDDTASIQASATAAAGKMLSFAPGATYLVSTIDISPDTIVVMSGATIKQKVMSALDGDPIFNVIGANVTFRGGTIDGQRASQPADGFADAFNTGPDATGRAYRAAIKADAVVTPGIANLRVEGVTFTELYGGAVATLDVPTVRVTGCDIHDSNFELAYLHQSAATLTDAWVTDNQLRDIGSGDAVTNANGIGIIGYARVTASRNHGYNIERTLVKAQTGSSMPIADISITDNIFDTNTVGYPGIQVQLWDTSDRILVKGNILRNVGEGILVAQAQAGGTSNSVNVSNNIVETTTSTSTADGIGVVLDNGKNVVIQGNTLLDIKRNGIDVQGQVTRLVLDGNVAYGQANATTWGIRLWASTGNFGSLRITGNHLENFEQSAVGAGMLALQRSAAYTFAHTVLQHNTILAGAATNHGIYVSGVDIILSGLVSDNYVDGMIEPNTVNVECRNNTQTGVGVGNVAITGTTQTTIGANGGASALTANPVGYATINKNGTAYIVPYYNA